jgi:DNA-binding NarL/FixJ family response regulator
MSRKYIEALIISGQKEIEPMFSAALSESPYRDHSPNETRAPLTTREMEIVKLVADGKTYREIAQILGLSVKTIDCYSQRIKLKTQCYSVALLVRLAIKNGWVDL